MRNSAEDLASSPVAGQRSLRAFTGTGYDKGRNYLLQVLWFATMNLVFMKWWLPPILRPPILRLFGAAVGANVLIRHRVRILWPWKLVVDRNTWIGEDAWIMNLEKVTIGHDVCVSQAASIVTGNHKISSPTFEFDNGEVVIESGAWLGFGSTVTRGVTIAAGTVVGANAMVTRNTLPNSVVRRHHDHVQLAEGPVVGRREPSGHPAASPMRGSWTTIAPAAPQSDG